MPGAVKDQPCAFCAALAAKSTPFSGIAGTVRCRSSGVTGANATVQALNWDATNSRLYVGGSFTNYNGTGEAYFMKLTSTGALDGSFNVGVGFDAEVWAIAVDTAGGKVYIGGPFSHYQGHGSKHIVRVDAATGNYDGAFNVLEALLPSLVSRLAPAEGRGVAIGVYNTTQTLGVFFGGLLGGWVASSYGTTAVFGVCAALVVVWLLIALGMRPVPAVNEVSRAAL